MNRITYTGHPFVDVGIATIVAFVDKSRPEDLVEEDLAKVGEYIEQNYTIAPLTSVLTMSLPNSGFTQPAYDEAKKREYARVVGQSLSEAAHQSDELCIFTGEQALSIPLGLKDDLAPGRAFRQHIPLLTGEGTINFFPSGDAGLPVSGIALLALQIMPLGCAKCGVGLLAVHSENPALMLGMTRRFLKRNLDAIGKAQAAHETKLPSEHRLPKTLLIENLIAADEDRFRLSSQTDAPSSLTAYNFTNSGQGVDLVIYPLPFQIVDFLRIVQNATYHEAWNALVHRAWQVAKAKKRGDAAEEFQPRKNFLYEDLFDLERLEQWRRFVRTYFLRIPRVTKAEDDPRRGYSSHDELQLVSWPLVELFLRKVVSMDKDRIAQIRTMGDRLAQYVRRQGGKRFYRDFFNVDRPSRLRDLLIRANSEFIKIGQEPLFDMDGYIDVFEEGIDAARPDWRLARDLVLMRMIDQLRDWLSQNPDATPETPPEGAADSTETESA
jgi:CRISPR-associated protein Cst1